MSGAVHVVIEVKQADVVAYSFQGTEPAVKRTYLHVDRCFVQSPVRMHGPHQVVEEVGLTNNNNLCKIVLAALLAIEPMCFFSAFLRLHRGQRISSGPRRWSVLGLVPSLPEMQLECLTRCPIWAACCHAWSTALVAFHLSPPRLLVSTIEPLLSLKRKTKEKQTWDGEEEQHRCTK